MNIVACHKLIRQREYRTWYRAFDPAHWKTPLSYGHTLGEMYRYSPGTFEVLHLSESHDLTLWEMGAVYGSHWQRIIIPDSRIDVQIINIEVDLQQVADLTSVAEQNKLRTNVQELTGDWKGFQRRMPLSSVSEPTGLAPTQELGAMMFSLGLEGFRAVSAKVSDQMNLVVFPRNMLKGSRLSYRLKKSKRIHEIVGTM